MKKKKKQKDIIIYQAKDGAIELRGDFKHENIWATQAQIAQAFGVDISTANEHIKNIYKTEELQEKATIRNFRIVQKEGKREVEREVNHYNLDMIISVGYRINSKTATKFRQWATKTLREHIVKGYTINRKQIAKNYDKFLQAVENVKKLLPAGSGVKAQDALELIKMFASTWFSLNAYDKEGLPKKGATKRQVKITADHIIEALQKLKEELTTKKEASELFGIEKAKGNISGIIGNVFQSFGGKDLYPTLEEKAAHLLYFMIKNHPFVDGNKRSGAFAFVWFLRKANILDIRRLTPEALTALTLFVAESNPKNKEQMIGLILMIL
jgi:death-on-curing family protein